MLRLARAFTRRHPTEETVSGSRSQEAVSLFRAKEQLIIDQELIPEVV